jgi:hypothetical protein
MAWWRNCGLAAMTVVATTLTVVGNAASVIVSEAERADEYRVKAAMLYNFAKFVEWPADSATTPAPPLNVCVLGVDPFGTMLDETLKGRLVAGRPLVSRRLSDIEAGCHLVFISLSERKRMAVIVDRLGASHVLTVSEDEGFGAVGGMIELVTQTDRVGFNIYPGALERVGLHASARLIELAWNQKHPAGGRR